jgi:hypothetical protein
MNPVVGWGLAAVFLFVAWRQFGWQGLAFGASVVAFWLVLQFNRSIRVLRKAGGAPLGHVPSAVMLHAKLRSGMQMLDVLTLTRSLGRRLDERGDVYAWADDGGAEVVVTFAGGRCRSWVLNRPAEPAE